jgi:acetolactate synthase regulatory subunit
VATLGRDLNHDRPDQRSRALESLVTLTFGSNSDHPVRKLAGAFRVSLRLLKLLKQQLVLERILSLESPRQGVIVSQLAAHLEIAEQSLSVEIAVRGSKATTFLHQTERNAP